MPVTVEGPSLPMLDMSIAAWIKANTVDIAERALKAEVGRGFDSQPDIITDGVLRRDYALVKPFGKIEFVARTSIADAVLWTLTELQKKSPVLTGRYASSHIVLINGAEITGNIRTALMAVKPGDRVQVVNTQPYARKLEGATANRKTGRGKRKPSSRKAPGGIYRPVLRALVQRWSKSILADFKYVKLNLGVRVWGDQGGRYKKIGKGRGAKWVKVGKVKRVQRDQVYPCIQIFARESQTVN
jgi:hypothetical protein